MSSNPARRVGIFPVSASPGRHARPSQLPLRLRDTSIRSLDITVSLASIVIASAPIVLFGLLVRLTSPGPALFIQERLGRQKRPFAMLKLRTMHVGSEDTIHREYVRSVLRDPQRAPAARGVFKLEADPRVTRVGAWLRRTSLDELPQLINVLRGEMSLVGPRPVLSWEAELFSPADQRRFDVKPGMTGLWQVSGRSKLSIQEELALDSEYARQRSLMLNLVILARTGPALVRGGTR